MKTLRKEQVEMLNNLYLAYFITSNQIHDLEYNGIYDDKKIEYPDLVKKVNILNPILESIRRQILAIK